MGKEDVSAHEAGHAFIASVDGWTIKIAKVEMGEKEYKGQVEATPPSDDDVVLARYLLAGSIAEDLLTGQSDFLRRQRDETMLTPVLLRLAGLDPNGPLLGPFMPDEDKRKLAKVRTDLEQLVSSELMENISLLKMVADRLAKEGSLSGVEIQSMLRKQ